MTLLLLGCEPQALGPASQAADPALLPTGVPALALAPGAAAAVVLAHTQALKQAQEQASVRQFHPAHGAAQPAAAAH